MGSIGRCRPSRCCAGRSSKNNGAEMMLRLGAVVVATGLLAAPASGEVLIGITPSLTGALATSGEGEKQTLERAIADLNAKGGVLGEKLRIVVVDDQCDADAAVLAARKLVAEHVAAVFGHLCSSAAVPASDIYEAAGIPMFATWSVDPRLTERGLRFVFRLAGRSDQEGALVAELLAVRYGDKPIAVIHDAQMASVGLSGYVRTELRRRGLMEVLDAELRQDQVEFGDLIAHLRESRAVALFCACFSQQAGLLVRQVWESGLKIATVTGNGASEDTFWILAGADAAQATLIPQLPDWTRAHMPELTALIVRFQKDGVDTTNLTYQAYAGVQAWAQAAERAKSTHGTDVAPILHEQRFDTVIGSIGFSEKGDIVGPVQWVWNRWRDGVIWEVSTEPLLRGEIVEK